MWNSLSVFLINSLFVVNLSLFVKYKWSVLLLFLVLLGTLTLAFRSKRPAALAVEEKTCRWYFKASSSVFGVGSVNWDLTPNQICVLAQRSQGATQLLLWNEEREFWSWSVGWSRDGGRPPPWSRPSAVRPLMATTVFDVWVVLVLDNVPDLVNMRCAWDDDITEGLSCLTQSELCWFLINCLQEFCFSHSDLFNAFKQFSLFRNSCVVSLRADVTSRFLVSLVTASGSSQGDESLWKSLGGPLSARCRSTVPSASQRLL